MKTLEEIYWETRQFYIDRGYSEYGANKRASILTWTFFKHQKEQK